MPKAQTTLRNEVHHWWPEALSRHWMGADGRVSQITPDGKIVRSLPANFGGLKNAHHVKVGGKDTPWNSTFEPDFGKADTQFGEIVAWLLSLESRRSAASDAMSERVLAQPLHASWRTKLAECLASLIVRSPSTRNRIKTGLEAYRREMGLVHPAADKYLIAANMAHLYGDYARSIGRGGKFLVLFTDSVEFIFGDGFLHNFPAPFMPFFNARCVVPITPGISVVFTRPMRYSTHPELMTMRLEAAEGHLFNYIVQVYSGERLFFRSQAPSLTTAFTDGVYCEFRHHGEPTLDTLLEAYVAAHPAARPVAVN